MIGLRLILLHKADAWFSVCEIGIRICHFLCFLFIALFLMIHFQNIFFFHGMKLPWLCIGLLIAYLD